MTLGQRMVNRKMATLQGLCDRWIVAQNNMTPEDYVSMAQEMQCWDLEPLMKVIDKNYSLEIKDKWSFASLLKKAKEEHVSPNVDR